LGDDEDGTRGLSLKLDQKRQRVTSSLYKAVVKSLTVHQWQKCRTAEPEFTFEKP